MRPARGARAHASAPRANTQNKFNIAQSLFSSAQNNADEKKLLERAQEELIKGNGKPMAELQERCKRQERTKQTELLEKLWRVYDRDGDGKISMDEHFSMMRDWFDAMYYHLPKLLTRNWINTMKTMIARMKASGQATGEVERLLEEKETVVRRRLPKIVSQIFANYDNDECYRKVYKGADRNKDGKIVKSEFVNAFFNEFDDGLNTSTLMMVIRAELQKISAVILGGGGGAGESEGVALEKQEIEEEAKMKMAQEAKALGNKLFRRGEFDDAIHQYTHAIGLVPRCAAFFSNRAHAFFQKGVKAGAAEEKQMCMQLCISDCEKAVEIAPGYVKAIRRHGLALHQVGKYMRALDMLSKLSDPDAQVRRIMQGCRMALEESVSDAEE